MPPPNNNPSLDRGECRSYNIYVGIKKGGDYDEVDVSPCNALLSVRLNALVLSRTLNCSSMVERSPVKLNKKFKKPAFQVPALFFAAFMIRSR